MATKIHGFIIDLEMVQQIKKYLEIKQTQNKDD